MDQSDLFPGGHLFHLENSRLLIRRILQSDWSIRGLYIG